MAKQTSFLVIEQFFFIENPDTPLEALKPYLKLIDFVCVMTVNPGFGGQKFMPEPLEKVRLLSEMGMQVEVDGGVKSDTAREVIEAGANILVSGSGVFGTKDPGATVSRLKMLGNKWGEGCREDVKYVVKRDFILPM